MDSPPRRRVLIVFNPTAGGGAKRLRLQRTIAKLTLAGCDVTLRPTTRAGDAERIAAETRPGDCDVLVAAGGDGTIHEVANGLGPDAPPLAFLPLGTANVLAHEIGLSARSTPVVEAIRRGPVAEIRCGLIDGRRFLLMAGAGFDAAVVRGIDPRVKRRLGRLAYALESLHQMLRYGFEPIRGTIDDAAFEASSCLVLNGRCYAGPYRCAPAGRLDAPGFHVLLFEAGGRLAVLRYGAALLFDRLPRAQGVRTLPATRVRLDAPPGAPVQADGDWIAGLPVAITVDPRPLRLILPPPPEGPRSGFGAYGR